MARPSVVLWSVKPTMSSAPSDGFTEREGGADGEAFAEIVEADADGDEQSQHPAARLQPRCARARSHCPNASSPRYAPAAANTASPTP